MDIFGRCFLSFLLSWSVATAGVPAHGALKLPHGAALTNISEEAVVAPLITDHRIVWRDSIEKLLHSNGVMCVAILGTVMVTGAQPRVVFDEPTSKAVNPVRLFSQSVDVFIDTLYRLHELSKAPSKRQNLNEIQAAKAEVLEKRDRIHREFKYRMTTVDAHDTQDVAEEGSHGDPAATEMAEGKRAIQRYEDALRVTDDILSDADVALHLIDAGNVIRNDVRTRYGQGMVSDVPLIDELRFEKQFDALRVNLQTFDAVDFKDEATRSFAANVVQGQLEALRSLPFNLINTWATERVPGPWKRFKSYRRKSEKQGRALKASA